METVYDVIAVIKLCGHYLEFRVASFNMHSLAEKIEKHALNTQWTEEGQERSLSGWKSAKSTPSYANALDVARGGKLQLS